MAVRLQYFIETHQLGSNRRKANPAMISRYEGHLPEVAAKYNDLFPQPELRSASDQADITKSGRYGGCTVEPQGD
jgi:hypothetical protein